MPRREYAGSEVAPVVVAMFGKHTLHIASMPHVQAPWHRHGASLGLLCGWSGVVSAMCQVLKTQQ